MLFGVPKPDGSTRPILNMSDSSIFQFCVNEFLNPELCTVEYAQFKECVSIVNSLGKGAYLWAKDIQDGYYNVTVHKSDIYNLAFWFDGKIYIFQRLPMGLSSSPKIFTDFMHFPIWAIKQNNPSLYYINVPASEIDITNFRNDSDIVYDNKTDTYKVAVVFYYMDDILGGHTNKDIAWLQFNHSEQILKLLNLPTKQAKARIPNQYQKWLGKMYDTIKQWVKLPDEKVKKYINDMEILLNKKSVTKRELLSHIGRTRHMGNRNKDYHKWNNNKINWVDIETISIIQNE